MPTQTMKNFFSDLDPKAESRRKLDAEILRLRICIADLSSQRNELAPVSMLPPEVIERIFVFARESTPANPTEPQEPCLPLVLSSVSRGWRNIALSCAKLWSVIDFIGLPGMDAFLERSKQEKLVVKLVYSTLQFMNGEENLLTLAVHRAFGESHRIEELQIIYDTTPGYLLPLWEAQPPFSNDPQAAPLLRRFTLVGVSLPDDIFNDHTPLLEHLALEYCQLSPTSMLFHMPALRKFKICLPAPETLLSVETLLPLLAQLPALEELHLDAAFNDRVVISHPVLPLPCLNVLTIKNAVTEHMTDLLSHLSIPVSTQVTINTFTPRDEDTCQALVQAVFVTCREQHLPPTSITVAGTEVEVSLESSGGKGKTSLTIQPHVDSRGFLPDPANLLQTALDILGGDNLRRLAIVDEGHITQEFLSDTLGALPELWTLRLSGRTSVTFLEYLEMELLRGVFDVYKGGWSEVAAELGLSKDVADDSELDSNSGDSEDELEYDDDSEGESEAEEANGTSERPSPVSRTHPDASAVLDAIGFSFRSLRRLHLTFPAVSSLDEIENIVAEDNVMLNLAVRRLNGIGLDIITYSNWPLTTKGLKRVRALTNNQAGVFLKSTRAQM